MKRVLIKDIMILLKKYNLYKKYYFRFYRNYKENHKYFICFAAYDLESVKEIEEILKELNYTLILLDNKYHYEVKYNDS